MSVLCSVLGHHMVFQTSRHLNGRLPPQPLKILAKHVLRALDFLHTECGIIHTDLKPSNILLELEDPQQAVAQHLTYFPARLTPGEYNDSGTVGKIPLREVTEMPLISEIRNPSFQLIDFGVCVYYHFSFSGTR